MAAFRPDLPRTLAATCLAALLWTPVAPAALAGEAVEEIIVDADGIQIDAENNRLRLPRVVIRQGAVLIRADEALAKGVEMSFTNAEWEFRGAVHIEFQNGELDADQATARFVANRLQTARATGAPATFSHQLKDSAQRNNGRAQRIELDMARERIRLAGDVWYTDGRSEFTTAALVYSLTDRSVETERSPSTRVRMIIRPESAPSASLPRTPAP